MSGWHFRAISIIDELQHFLMELGKGYTFVGRQMRLTFDEQHSPLQEEK